MQRNLHEILASQAQMLCRLGRPVGDVDDSEMRDLFERHLAEVKKWLVEGESFSVIHISYNQILQDPGGQSLAIKQFLGEDLDVDKMAAVVDEGLYRQKMV